MPITSEVSARTVRPLFERAALWFLIAILAWVQFPLGSNREWSWSLLALLVAVDWCIWIPAALSNLGDLRTTLRRVAFSGILFLIVLAWAWVQTLGATPQDWHHPLWHVVDGTFGKPVHGAVSIDPYASQTEVLKLSIYLAIGFIATYLSLHHDNARKLLVTVVVVGAAYAIYGLILSSLRTSQVALMENEVSEYGRAVTGGFVGKNNFATFTGLSLLASLALLIEAADQRVVTIRGWRTHMRTLLQFATEKGSPWIITSFVLIIALIAAVSRAGAMATLFGLLVMFGLTVRISARKGQVRWTLVGGGAAALAIITLFFVSGDNLAAHFGDLIGTQSGPIDLRVVMWADAMRAIQDRPLFGSGLNTFGAIYPAYATEFVSYVIDHVHNDYLELALGLGIPMASVWVIAVLILAGKCVRGALRRRRRRYFAITAVGATALVGLHSITDFSLQIPAVSVLFAVLMGVGLGQCQSQREEMGRTM